MGAGPSLGKFLKSMDDHDLAELVQSAYTLEPHRMEKIFALAKRRYHEGQQQHQQTGDVDTVGPAAVRAALSSPTQPTVLPPELSSPTQPLLPPPALPSPSRPLLPPSVSSSPSRPLLPPFVTTVVTEMARPDPPVETSTAPTSSPSCGVVDPVTAVPSMDGIPDTNDSSMALGGVKDPMNALWTFEGHPLRELQAADKNPQNVSHRALSHQGLLSVDRLVTSGGDTDLSIGAILKPQRGVDAEDYPVMYGSCGRDKRYGRCSVCYFRGLRCNTAHYCACCQRSVCIRPRKYPGEEHHKICWNVLHMDKDMIQRVEKKKKRKLQALTAADTTAAPMAVSRVKSAADTCYNGEADTKDDHRQNNIRGQPAAGLDRGPPAPAIVADVSGAVNL
ncbi:unnamed protein product [Hyaloperonospora brassicae]|uniref:Uncharacterized protein n=1 Tax=Hyaloperonospora brassicae TaxID=162125 RepID=A0AAV0U0I6_HYABA|nr:unnamed protein product [Hyaloperonospora brassicae]